MGMYTGLRCKVIIKEEYRKEFDRLFNNYKRVGNRLYWKDSNIDFLKKFGEYSRADFIPYGALDSMPDEWENCVDGKDIPTDGFENKFESWSGHWSFQCSLKNYDSTIEYFLDVLNVVVEKIIHLEMYYEEDRYSKLYKLENGKIILDNPEFIDYKGEYY